MVKNPEIATISLDGEALCLNFTNTVHHRKEEPLRDYLKNSLDLIAWAEKVELVDEKRGKRLEKVVTDNPKKARNFFVTAITLRELLFRMFFSITAGKKVGAPDLAEFNGFLKNDLAHLRLAPVDTRYKESWDFADDSLQQITAPILKDAYELLLSDKLRRVKECPNCGWLFLDTTKNGKRRWCSMKACGSNIKALEWYYRQKEG